jgi:TrmH family RNA methyltransferase
LKKITSLNNEIIKETVKLHQKKYRNDFFLMEGLKTLEEAIDSHVEIVKIFVKENSEIPEKWREYDIYEVNEAVMKKISTTETPPEVVAIARQKKFALKSLFKTPNPIIVVLENIKDAGNLGTIIRTAAASDISGIVLVGETVDLYNPKTVRSAAGNLWKIPIVEIDKKAELKEILLKEKKCKFFATVVNKENQPENYFSADFKGASVIMFGAEADGLSQCLINQADCPITIPMQDSVESLNLSISVGVVVYESLRQRMYE